MSVMGIRKVCINRGIYNTCYYNVAQITFNLYIWFCYHRSVYIYTAAIVMIMHELQAALCVLKYKVTNSRLSSAFYLFISEWDKDL